MDRTVKVKYVPVHNSDFHFGANMHHFVRSPRAPACRLPASMTVAFWQRYKKRMTAVNLNIFRVGWAIKKERTATRLSAGHPVKAHAPSAAVSSLRRAPPRARSTWLSFLQCRRARSQSKHANAAVKLFWMAQHAESWRTVGLLANRQIAWYLQNGTRNTRSGEGLLDGLVLAV
jgi:hypothetical protein